MKKVLTKLLILAVSIILPISMLASCGMQSYSRLGISFEIPSKYEERAVAGALMAFGDEESFIVFNKYSLADLSKLGLSTLDVQNYTEKILESTEITESVEPSYSASGKRADFSYIVQDPETTDLYYYYYTVVMQGSGSIWVVQMACYEPLAYEYGTKFAKWASSLKAD